MLLLLDLGSFAEAQTLGSPFGNPERPPALSLAPQHKPRDSDTGRGPEEAKVCTTATRDCSIAGNASLGDPCSCPGESPDSPGLVQLRRTLQ